MLVFTLLSIYIPYEKTQDPVIFPFEEYEFQTFCSRAKSVVSLIVSDPKEEKNQVAIQRFSRAIPEFSNKIQMVTLTQSQVPRLNSIFNYSEPYLVMISNGQISLNTKIPEDDLGLATILRFWTTSLRFTATTVQELFTLLGPTPYALIMRDNQLNDGFKFLIDYATSLGTTEILTATQNVFDKLDMSNATFIFFRRNDKELIPLTYENLTARSFPSNVTSKTFAHNFELSLNSISENSTIIGLVSQFKYSEANLASKFNDVNESLRDALSTLHLNYPEFNVALIHSDDDLKYAESFTQQSFDSNTNSLIVFNREEGYYYPNDDIFQKLTVESPQWNDAVHTYLEKIRDPNNRRYRSEQLDSSTGPIKKLVGLNYEQFIKENNNDILILFHDHTNSTDLTFYKEREQDYQRMLSELLPHTSNLDIAIIDPMRNSSPMKYPPLFKLPLFVLYKKDQKDRPICNFEENNLNSLVRFLTNNDVHLDLTPKNLSTEQAVRTIEAILQNLPKMNSDLRFDAMNYINKYLKPVAAFDPFDVPLYMSPLEAAQLRRKSEYPIFL